MKKKIGKVFWIEGFSGSGKTSISKLIQNDLSKKFGTTIILSGDILRKFLDKKGYSKKDRINNSYKFSEILKYLTEQKLNIIYSAVCLNNSARNIYKKNIKNFFQIYIKSDIEKILKLNKKKTYKNKKNILGIHIKPEFPSKPDVIIENNFDKSLKKISRELIEKIKKKFNK
tara:strand:+ start:1008 stop:1523 length:516 start_codon:yes stop_codon:yes gene_type:complete